MKIAKIWRRLPKNRASLILDPDSHIRHGFKYPARLVNSYEYDSRILRTPRGDF